MSPIGCIAIGRDRTHLGDFAFGADLARTLVEIGHHSLDRLVDAAAQIHRVHAGGNRLRAFTHDRLGQNRRSRGAVTSNVVGLGSDLTDHLGAHVLELVIELDFLGDRHTVLGDTRRAEGLVQNHGAALGTQRDLDSVGQNVDAAQHARRVRPHRTSRL